MITLLWACGCTPLPDIPPLPREDSQPPVLVPLDDLLGSLAAPRATDAAAAALSARAARLRARASLMRGPVLSPQTRDALRAAIARGEA